MSSNLPSDPKKRDKSDPFSEMLGSFNDLFPNEFIKGFLKNMDELFQTPFPAFSYHMEEHNRETVITADLPGIKKEQIQIDLFDNSLTITVKNSEIITEEDDANHLYSRRQSLHHMSRNFQLGYPINEKKIKASFQNGLLKIQIPKPIGRTLNIESE